jgi:hypothetical protein
MGHRGWKRLALAHGGVCIQKEDKGTQWCSVRDVGSKLSKYHSVERELFWTPWNGDPREDRQVYVLHENSEGFGQRPATGITK